ncbi:nuclear transport factor 2 family protein [Saccharospirillum mangrovi]|uniref:nuclear transport factor 2 family protein n=1 Tax=Saccharospirillum mangrovi TaxID=2161747 RepID=UPI000D3C962A|nr:nuclear transport factor 2 family protein [Saccharospirillum mangrovi]
MSHALSELDRCLIHRAVEALIIRTGKTIDSKQFQALDQCFHAEGRLYRPTTPEPLIGPAAIAASYEQNPAQRLNRHLVSNLSVDIESANDVRAHCYVTLYSSDDGELVDGVFGAPLHRCLVGEFHDRCVNTDAGWRILERRASFTLKMPVGESV